MRFDVGQLAELTDYVKREGTPRLLLAPALALPAELTIPPVWRDLLMRDDAHKHAASLLWASATRALPQVVAAIEQTLQGVGLLITDVKQPSLVYIFTGKGEIFARRGYLPTDSLPPASAQLSVDLSVSYRIHNGWVDWFTGGAGPLPTEEWQILGSSQAQVQDGFLEVFTNGGNHMGFDLSEHPAGSYIIWSDGDVEPVDDFWGRLDNWMLGWLQAMDRTA